MRWGDPSTSEILLGGWLGMLTLLWAAMVAGAGAWTKRNALPPVEAPQKLPRLTIAIPARNEAGNIGACVRAALAQDHPDFEVIVVDDGSTDGTGEEARAAAAGDPRFHLLQGTALPKGWAGKPWACQRAAGEASGAQILFVDADVTLAPEAARAAAAVMVARGIALFSAFGAWRLESFWERAAIPVIGWFIRGATDLAAVNNPGRGEAFANGQFILVDRAAYDTAGGHGAVRAEVLEDVRLARAFKQRGLRLGLYYAPHLFNVRLYRSLREIVNGYTKNLYEGMDRKPQIALGALLFLFIGTWAPWLFLAVALGAPTWLFPGIEGRALWTAWIGVVCALPLLLRFRLDRVEGRSGGMFWTHPLGNLVLGLVLTRALFTVRTEWKGRTFHDGKAEG